MEENPDITCISKESEQEKGISDNQLANDTAEDQNLENLVEFRKDKEAFICCSELKEKYLDHLCRQTFHSKLRRLGISPKRTTQEETSLLRKRLRSSHGALYLIPKETAITIMKTSHKRKHTNDPTDSECSKVARLQKKHFEENYHATDRIGFSSLNIDITCKETERETDKNLENDTGKDRNEQNSLEDSEYHQDSPQPCEHVFDQPSSNASWNNCQKENNIALTAPSAQNYEILYETDFSRCDKEIKVNKAEKEEKTKTKENVRHICDEQNESTQTEIVKSKRSRKTIDFHDLSPNVQADLSMLKKYWTKSIAADRNSPPLAESTMKKVCERISQFFWYCKYVKEILPTLALVEDISLVEQFVEYLQTNPKKSTGTVALAIQSLLYAAKFNNRSNFFRLDEILSIRKLRNIQAGLLRMYDHKRKMSNPSQNKGKLKLFWTEILDIVRKLISTYESFNGNCMDEGRLLHDIVLTLMLVSASPNRNIDYMKLILIDRRLDDKPIDDDELMEENKCTANYLILTFDGQLIIRDYVYKTAKDYGSSDLPITDIEYLRDYLLLYIDKSRKRILMENSHDFLFVKNNGQPFNLSSEFSYYLSCVFGRYGRRLTTGDLRHALVTYVLEHPDTNEELRKSLASLMKHSIKHQENTYYLKNYSKLKSPALKFLSENTGKYLGLTDQYSIGGSSEEEPTSEQSPEPGNIVALAAADSTIRSPQIFLAKLLQYKDNGENAVLGEMELAEGSSKCYRLKPGSSWIESTRSIVWPIDVAYIEKGDYYRLRTSPKEIHKFVKQSL